MFVGRDVLSRTKEEKQMVDIATVTATIGAAASAVKLFDKIADQVERFITKSPEPSVPPENTE